MHVQRATLFAFAFVFGFPFSLVGLAFADSTKAANKFLPAEICAGQKYSDSSQ